MPRDEDEDTDDDRPRRRRRDDEDEDRPRRRRDEDDEDDDDDDDERPKRRKPTGSNGMATTSLVLGVLSLCGGCFTGVPAMICGFLGLSKSKTVGTGKGLAIAGLATGAFGTFVITGVAGYFVSQVGDFAGGVQRDVNNGKQITIALHNYADTMGNLPNPYGPRGNQGFGQPPAPALLSWRVDLLPYLEQAALAQQFDATQPWNGPKNAPLAKTVVKPYQFSYDPATDPQTRWRGFTGKPDGRGSPVFTQGQQVRITSIVDGTSNTLFCFEATDPAGWTEPNDFPFGPNSPMPAYGGRATRPALFLMVDGSVRAIAKGRLNDLTFRAMVTKDGGEVVAIP